MDDNCGEWVKYMGVANGRGYQEVGVASGWNLWVWLVSVVVRRYIIDILIIIITFPYSTCISSFFGSIILISLFIFKCFFLLVIYTVLMQNRSCFTRKQTCNGEYTKHCTRSRHQLKMAAPAEVSEKRSNFRIRQF